MSLANGLETVPPDVAESGVRGDGDKAGIETEREKLAGVLGESACSGQMRSAQLEDRAPGRFVADVRRLNGGAGVEGNRKPRRILEISQQELGGVQQHQFFANGVYPQAFNVNFFGIAGENSPHTQAVKQCQCRGFASQSL